MRLERYLIIVSLLRLSFCKENRPIALIGTLLLPEKTIVNGTILIIDELIAAVGHDISIPLGTKLIETNGLILPGLIDLHNHLVWNIFPRWKPTEEFNNRYDWQQKSIYKTLIAGPHKGLRAAKLGCEMQRYAEVKAISQGTTSLIGSLREPCNQGLARNLDDDLSFGQILYNVFPLQMSESELKETKKILSSNGTLFLHLAEGKPTDAASAREFSLLKARDLLQRGVSIIHGVALDEHSFVEMSKSDVGLIWSPRSNLELYGDTVDIRTALKTGVTIAIAPDWSPTGSDGLLSELNYAAAWNLAQARPIFTDDELLRMATINAAKLTRLDQRLGVLKEGFLADLIVLQGSSVTQSVPEDIDLVMIDGKAVYGDPNLMKNFVKIDELETLEICGVKKSLRFPSTKTFHRTCELLDHELRRWGRRLAPLSECGQ